MQTFLESRVKGQEPEERKSYFLVGCFFFSDPPDFNRVSPRQKVKLCFTIKS